MSNIVKNAELQLKTCIESAVKEAMNSGQLPENDMPEIQIEIPADRSHGDYSTNIAMAGARIFRMAPPKIADIIVKNLKLENTYFKTATIAGAGFINFTLGENYYSDILLDVGKKRETYGHSDFGNGKKVLVEFVSANPTGPMHVGNARGGALGDTLAEVLTWAGYYAEREFYVNDAGNQIEKFALSLDIRYRQHFGEEVEMPEDAYQGADITAHAENFAKKYGDKYINADENERKNALVDFALPLNIEGLRRDLMAYRIEYNTWFKESTLHNNGEVDRTIELLKNSGHTYESEGALWFKATDFGCDKDFVLVRSNGIPTYIVPDIAYHYNKLAVRNFDIAIDVLGADHHGYIPRLKAALNALGVDSDRLQVVLMQMVRLINMQGEVIKASKRSGKAITLVTLLDEVSTDAARFEFNRREANTHCDFNIDLAVEKSSQNPVYYCQYAHARICSILEKSGAGSINATAEQLNNLTHDAEKELIRHIAGLTDEVINAAKQLDPSKITRYVYDLATLFHKFYNACRCDCDDVDLKTARLYLCKCTKQVLANVFALLKITAPEEM